MSIIVHKFGGGCFRSKLLFQRVKAIIEDEIKHNQVIIVCSAVYGVTDLLKTSIDESITEEIIDELQANLIKIHENIFGDSGDFMLAELKRLRAILNGFIFSEKRNSKLTDLILSFGERMVSSILARIFENAEILWPEDFLLTTQEYGNASYKLEQIQQKTMPKHLKGKLYIVPGFYGVDEEKNVHLVGRSGTDYTGAVISSIFNANSYIIWKEVDGFMSIDPNIVGNASTISSLSYKEGQELAFFGATILHEKTIEIIKLAKIPLYIKKLDNPDVYTLIGSSENNQIKSISFIENVSLMRIHEIDNQRHENRNIRILEIFKEMNINIISINTSFTTISLIISSEDTHIVSKLMISNFTLKDKLSLIAIVGKGIHEQKSLIEFIHLMNKEDISIDYLSSGINERILYVLIPKNHLMKTLPLVHAHFKLENKSF